METIDIQVMGREFSVAVKPDEKEILLSASNLVDRKMREIATKAATSSADTLAVMAAISLVHDFLLSERSSGGDLPNHRRRINAMSAKAEQALAQQEKLF